MYIGVADPITHRKNLLLCSRDLITSLKNYERLKSIRVEKTTDIFALRKLIQEIIVLNRKLKQFLPKVELPKQPHRERHITTKRTIPKARVKSKVDALQKELDRIEGKLRKLE